MYPLDPDQSEIDLGDIAHALSNICRFTGHCSRFYSVARHSLLVSYLAERHGIEFARVGLMHDATEAYLCDVARPIKDQDGFSAYRVAETRLWVHICLRFSLDAICLPGEVREIDERIVTNEAIAFMPCIPEGWQLRPAFTDAEMAVVPPEFSLYREEYPAVTRQLFLKRAAELGVA